MAQKLTVADNVTLADIANAFHPLALTEEQRPFYQQTAAVRGGESYEFYELLHKRIKTSNSKAHILVVGHGGCGKSTELRMLTAELHGDGIPSVTIEAREDLDQSKFSYIDILMLIVESLAKYAEDRKLKVSQHIIAAFNKALSTTLTTEYWERKAEASVEAGASATIPLSMFFKAVFKITGSFKASSDYTEELRRQFDPKFKEIINAINALIDEVNAEIAKKNISNKIVIIIDGLEKCNEKNVKKLFSENSAALSTINTHLIVACPISIYRSPIASTLVSYFDRPAIMPMIKTHHKDSVNTRDDRGIAVIKELILKRVDSAFFEENVLENIIMMGGGSLRDTCCLVRDSAFEAYMRGRTTVDYPSFEYAMNGYATDVFYRAQNSNYPMLKKIFDGLRTPISDESLSALLYVGAVFEYNGEGWVDLHPLMRRYLEQRPEVFRD